MICRKIEIQNFRNVASCEVEFSPHVNLLYGNNAQGKTNLLEAIYFTALGKSFRPAKETEMIRHDQPSASVINTFEDSIRKQTLSVQMFGGRAKRIVKHNGVKVDKLSDMMGVFRVVLFCPEHLSIVKDGPAERRSFFDVAISQIRPLYIKSLQRYNNILKERNALLKSAADDRASFDATIDLFSTQLAHEAAIITGYRAAYTEKLQKYVCQCFADMTDGREQPTVEYLSSSKLSGDDLKDAKKVVKRL